MFSATSSLFFESNDSANDIRDRIMEALEGLGYGMDDVRVYLREDRDAAE